MTKNKNDSLQLRLRYNRLLASGDVIADKIANLENVLRGIHRDVLETENALAELDDESAWETKRLRLRAVEMADRYDAGETLDEIGRSQSPPITRERVRQIILPFGSTEKRKEVFERKRQAAIAKRNQERIMTHARRSAAVDLVIDHGYTYGAAADAVQLNEGTVWSAVNRARQSREINPLPGRRLKVDRRTIVTGMLDAGSTWQEIADALLVKGDRVTISSLRQWAYNHLGSSALNRYWPIDK